MFMYFIMFLIPAFMAISNASKQSRFTPAMGMLVGTVLTVFIGLRDHVGGDWNNYLARFYQMQYLSLDEALKIKDPGYQLISYYMYDWGWGFYALIFICALLFVFGFVAFLRRQINPWLAFAVAVPYLIIVVSMGYIRQGVALGLVMWGLAALDRGKFYRFLMFVAFAVTFHKSAILMIAFGVFQRGKSRWLKILAVAVGGYGVWSAFLAEASEALWKNYVDANMQSEGAMVRVLLNVIPSILLLLFRKKWKENFNDYTLWSMVAFASLASFALVGFASTAVDRMALYFIPIQLVVYSRLPLLASSMIRPRTTATLIVIFYAAVLFVWLNFGSFSRYWIPYHTVLFSGLL